MHHNPQPAPDHRFRLPDQAVLAVSGRDALAFAQAQCMNDISALADGQWQWNGWLTPKGRVIALFAALRLDADTLWLLVPDAGAAALAAALQRYVFRSKLALAALDAPVSGRFGPPRAAAGARFARLDDGALELDMGGAGGPRTLRIGGPPAAEDAAAATAWDAADLAHGLPRLPAAQAGQWTPQQLSLERLRAFSVKKGCYPGQEIVARTHFLGQAKRGLALFQADPPPAPGSDVSDGARALGTVVASAGAHCLAVLPLERDAAPLQAGGITLREAPLLDGLAR
ncbi:MAG TPA: folate-binding protein [Thermomonas sp.]|nr:folate-binding protein [Thermomonas sp.]